MKHGLTGYVRHKCRCEICKTARRASAAKSYRKNLEENRAKARKRSAEERRKDPTIQKARITKWRAANPEQAKAGQRKRAKRYADANRDVVRERYRVWLAANPEKQKACDLAYRKAHPEKAREAAKRRRVRLQGGEICKVTEQDWLRLCRRFDNRCAYCGDGGELQKDHVIPITRGGRHSIGNLLPACKPCNSSKNDRLLTEWGGRETDLPTPVNCY